MASPGRETVQWALAMVYAFTTAVIVFTIETSDHELSWVGAAVLFGVLLVLMKRTQLIVNVVQYVWGDGEG